MKVRVWDKNDHEDKRFLQILQKTPSGYQPIAIQQLIIGQPCILQLYDGRIVQTSAVQSWTVYGHTEIQTQSRRYYFV